ncbi:hypothetical protein COLO4_38235 [Corchorus olitorius]|uniref:Uncharacterized protein n=1 Tax=Corchorus olitorius TaxID=93759 RepID=A0A1R3FW50_9ROSI|nr:hypothetical protein COLO4_38235 [Corchorus olitorius]
MAAPTWRVVKSSNSKSDKPTRYPCVAYTSAA